MHFTREHNKFCVRRTLQRNFCAKPFKSELYGDCNLRLYVVIKFAEELCANNSCMKDILTDADTLADSNNYFFDDYRHRFRVEKYNISYCRILKCSSTLMKKVIRLLHDPIKVISNGELLYHKNMSYDESLVFEKWADKVDESSQTMANGLNESRWHHVAIIRDPMDRFLASWVFFCVKKW